LGEEKANMLTSSLPLLPLPSKPCLVGIARLAAEGESLCEGHNVEYFTLESKSLLNRCVSRRALPFTWTINPYRGCEFACRYCYARYTHEFMELRNGLDFEQKIYVKQHAASLLRRELCRVKPSESIALGTATDPYQPAERRCHVTGGILEEFARQRDFELGIVTKSDLIVRDLDLLQEVARRNKLSVHLTITTLNADLARILEPRAPRPDLRLAAVRALRRAGLRVGVSCSPIIPGITDARPNLESVIRAAASSGAEHVFGQPLFLKPCSSAVFLPFLEQNFPHLVESYRQRYRGRAFLAPAYARRVSQLVRDLRAKCRVIRAHRRDGRASPTHWPMPLFDQQMDLFCD
jgi:DNA repair photolyase